MLYTVVGVIVIHNIGNTGPVPFMSVFVSEMRAAVATEPYAEHMYRTQQPPPLRKRVYNSTLKIRRVNTKLSHMQKVRATHL
jgi:hypothetical protein